MSSDSTVALAAAQAAAASSSSAATSAEFAADAIDQVATAIEAAALGPALTQAFADDTGIFTISNPTRIEEDSSDAGTYLIGA